MTDKEKLEKVKAEIERRYNYHKDHADDYAGTDHFWKADEDRELLSFIDSMQEEPVSDDLDEATNNYCLNVRKGYPRVKDETDIFICNAFMAGVKWQKERIMENSTNATIGLPYENKDGGYTHLVDVSRPLPAGNNKIVIIFKEN